MNALGINLWNWAPTLEEGLPFVERAADLGFTAVEFPMTSPVFPDAAALRARLDGLFLRRTLCASLPAGADLSSFDAAEREAAAARLRAVIDSAVAVGARVVAGPLYTGGGKRHALSPEDARREWGFAADGLAALGEYAFARGVTLAVEPLNRYRTSVVNRASQAVQLVRDTGARGVGVLFDTYQACIEEESVTGALRMVLEEGLLAHFHACANHRGAPGTGHLPWAELFSLLRWYGYEGHITMETFCPGALDAGFFPLSESQDALAAAGLANLRALTQNNG